jgi:hypothetical protein
MPTFGKFSETLDLVKSPDRTIQVVAKGPKDANETIKEICAWVFQRNGDDDAAATEMTTVPSGKEAFTQTRREWTLPLMKIESDVAFRKGPAIAAAIALIEIPITDANGNSAKAEKVLIWSQSIDLGHPSPPASAGRARRRPKARN